MTTDLCPECGESLWAPNPDKPELAHILLRWVHLHEGKKLTKIVKFLPVDWSMDDDESKKHGRLTPSQEIAIQMCLSQQGTSDGALIGDEPGFGKTAIGAETLIRAGWKRGLIIGLPDTHRQWFERIYAQSDGEIQVRIMNGTAAGRANYEAFMKHEPGIFVAGSHYLAEKDWESQPEWQITLDGDNNAVKWPVFKQDKKTGQFELRDRPEAEYEWETVFPPSPAEWPVRREVAATPAMIGPAAEPVRKMKSVRKNTFARIGRKPLEFVMFDEVQAIANRKSKTRQTILSIKAGFRIGMSGTWFLNKLDNMWSVARWVWPGDNPDTGLPYVETSHERWVNRFLVQANIYSKNGRVLETARGTALKETLGERVEGEFVSTLPAYIRRENEPVPEAHVIRVQPTAEQRAQIEDLKRDLMTWVMGLDGQEQPLVVDIPPVLRTRLRQAAIAEMSLNADETVFFADDAKSSKLAPLRYFIEDRWADQPVIIYTDSKIGAHFIAKRMQSAGVDARAWTGDLSRPDRQKLKDAFLAGEFRHLVVTVQSFGTGIDGFQKVCNKVVWISQPQGDPAMEDQAIRRVFRPGMTTHFGGFEHAIILMEDSADVETFEALLAQAWQVRTAMNDSQVAA